LQADRPRRPRPRPARLAAPACPPERQRRRSAGEGSRIRTHRPALRTPHRVQEPRPRRRFPKMMTLLDGLLAGAALAAIAGWSVTARRLAGVRRLARLSTPQADGRHMHALAEESARFGVWELDPA